MMAVEELHRLMTGIQNAERIAAATMPLPDPPVDNHPDPARIKDECIHSQFFIRSRFTNRSINKRRRLPQNFPDILDAGKNPNFCYRVSVTKE